MSLINSSEVIVDTSYLNLLTLISLLSPFAPAALIFGTESAIIYFKTPAFLPDQYPGQGTVALKAIPNEIMVVGGKKLVMSYNDIKVSSGGVYAGGLILEKDRQPSIEPASGTIHLTIAPGTPQVNGYHKLTTYDLRPNLEITWSIGGHVIKTTTSTLTTPSTIITYNSEEAKVGSPAFKTLKVKVTDSDNLIAEQEFRVGIYVTPPQDEFPDIPPICRAKPWLPQCEDL